MFRTLPAPVHASSVGISDYPYDVFVTGNYAYVANNLGNALEIIDVTNPAPVKKIPLQMEQVERFYRLRGLFTSMETTHM